MSELLSELTGQIVAQRNQIKTEIVARKNDIHIIGYKFESETTILCPDKSVIDLDSDDLTNVSKMVVLLSIIDDKDNPVAP